MAEDRTVCDRHTRDLYTLRSLDPRLICGDRGHLAQLHEARCEGVGNTKAFDSTPVCYGNGGVGQVLQLDKHGDVLKQSNAKFNQRTR